MSAPEPAVPAPRSPLAGVATTGRYGAAGGTPLAIAEIPAAIVQLAARRGRAGDLARAVSGAFGLDLPPPGRAASARGIDAIWIQPDAWLLLAPRGAEGALAAEVKRAAGDAGSVVDQSHGKTLMSLAGAAARRVMAKGCRLDLDAPAFGPGRAAVTQIAQIGCVVHQRDAIPTYGLVVPSSLAIPFFEWLTSSAAEFGYEVG
ncbi:MAG: sarcosine oxidase subunit gamma [Alphaproteobacteria bacterium]|nr:sarcosine oxidase subunit gamma [Alphaproteobacteria bacterium]